MKLLLIVCLTCALLNTAESLRCHVCTDSSCTNTTSVLCPTASNACRTGTIVRQTGTSLNVVTVERDCSSLSACLTPATIETEFSVNRGFTREAHTQICCVTDNCNFQVLAVPNTQQNGKICPACSSSVDALAGNCTSSVNCDGNENSCFDGTTTFRSATMVQRGCMSRYLCTLPADQEALLGENTSITCGAPWTVSISSLLLSAALTAHKVLA